MENKMTNLEEIKEITIKEMIQNLIPERVYEVFKAQVGLEGEDALEFRAYDFDRMFNALKNGKIDPLDNFNYMLTNFSGSDLFIFDPVNDRYVEITWMSVSEICGMKVTSNLRYRHFDVEIIVAVLRGIFQI